MTTFAKTSKVTRLALSVVILSGLALAACSKAKKPDEQPVQVGETTNDPNVTSTPMNFDPMGSDSGTIAGLQTVYFPYDQAQLTSEARKSLQSNAEWIKANPNTVIQVEGHCDSRGSIEYNLALGERRAKAVRAYLVSLGVDTNRLTIVSYGEEKPLMTEDSEAAHAKNRRANFLPIQK